MCFRDRLFIASSRLGLTTFNNNLLQSQIVLPSLVARKWHIESTCASLEVHYAPLLLSLYSLVNLVFQKGEIKRTANGSCRSHGALVRVASCVMRRRPHSAFKVVCDSSVCAFGFEADAGAVEIFSTYRDTRHGSLTL